MTEKQHEHLDSIVETLTERIRTKYAKGVAEHGGNIWEKGGLINEAINEVVDLAVYLLTLKTQIENLKAKFDNYAATPGVMSEPDSTVLAHFVCPANKKVGSMYSKCCHCNPHKECIYQLSD